VRGKRSPWEYIINAGFGPVAGIPVVADVVTKTGHVLLGELFNALGLDVKMPRYYNNSLIPLNDIRHTYGKIERAFTSDSMSWDERTISFMTGLRSITALVALGASKPTSGTKVKAKVAALALATATNILDFVFKSGKNAYELIK